jgi:hypothetical protein
LVVEWVEMMDVNWDAYLIDLRVNKLVGLRVVTMVEMKELMMAVCLVVCLEFQ